MIYYENKKYITLERAEQIALQTHNRTYRFRNCLLHSKRSICKRTKCPLEDEFDTSDEIGETCKHILVYYNELPVGTGRIRFVDGAGKLERICILKDYRKYGLEK